MARALEVLVTVGMGPYPFDRLIGGLGETCEHNHVFAQIGSSTVIPPCAYARFLNPLDLAERMRRADVVITHAGNTVRQVQRLDKVPIAVARRSKLGEMSNDHQVAYLLSESRLGRVVMIETVEELAAAVERHPVVEPAVLSLRARPPDVDGKAIAKRLDELAYALIDSGEHRGYE